MPIVIRLKVPRRTLKVAYHFRPIILFTSIAVLVAVVVQYRYNFNSTNLTTMSEMRSVAYFVNWVCIYGTLGCPKKKWTDLFGIGNLWPQSQSTGSTREQVDSYSVFLRQRPPGEWRSVRPVVLPLQPEVRSDMKWQIFDRHLVRYWEALPGRFLEWWGNQCVWMCKANVSAQETKPQTEGVAFHRWLDLFGQFRSTCQHWRGPHRVCGIGNTFDPWSGIWWYFGLIPHYREH